MSRSTQITLGLVTTALSAAGIGFAIFGPVTFSYPPPDGNVTASTTSMWVQGLTGTFLLYLAVIAVAALGVGIGTHARPEGGGAMAVWLVWVSAIILTITACLALPGMSGSILPSALYTGIPDSVSIGAYFMPAAATALFTAVVETFEHGRPPIRTTLRQH